MEQLAQHRQHALALPALAIAAELHDPPLPDALVLVELLQLGQRQAEGATGQRGAQRAVDVRLGAGAQPQQQVARLLAGEHRILVRQVDAAHPARGQLAADRLGFLEVAHQYGDVAGAQRLELVPPGKAGAALLAEVEQAGDFAGRALGQLLAVAATGQRLVAGQLPEIERRLLAALDLPDLPTPLRRQRVERQRVAAQRVVRAFAEQEGTAAERTLLGQLEHPVDRRHHRMA
ncbi:hypothetical protein D3C80_1316570 [compost metagenome]